MELKRLEDGTVIPDGLWYYILDYCDRNKSWYLTNYGKNSIKKLTREQFTALFQIACTHDIEFVNSQ